MTAFKTVTINCDWQQLGLTGIENTPGVNEGCPGWFETGTDRIPVARREAKRGGWTTVPASGRGGHYDLCWPHTLAATTGSEQA